MDQMTATLKTSPTASIETLSDRQADCTSVQRSPHRMLDRIEAMLRTCTTDSPLFPPTVLYNEGWLLRLALNWFSESGVVDHPLSSPEGARWFSEALLPSAFLARYRGDPRAESRTHADGVAGHFAIGEKGKADLLLEPDAAHFVVLEAKLFSKLASGTTNARYFDQAARSVACIAEVLHRAGRPPEAMSRLGFYVLAPRSRIERGIFAQMLNRDSIRAKVARRVEEYEGTKAQWYQECFEPVFDRVDIGSLSWEEVIGTLREYEPSFAGQFQTFYERCKEFNR